MTDTLVLLFAFVGIPFIVWAILYLVAYAVLWLIFKLYFNEYEMDSKSMSAISAKTFAAFLIINIFSFFVARRLFVRSGMEKKDASKISILWIVITILIIAAVISVRLMSMSY